MQAVILAGGLGTRLRPITESIPKSMIRIGGKPFLEYQINLLKQNGILDVVLCVGHLHEQIENYFANGNKWGVSLTYSYEVSELLGTGGAIKNAEHYLKDEFFVMYGDSYLPINFKSVYRFFKEKGAIATMVVYKNECRYDRSNVILKGERIVVYDKKNPLPQMQYIDYGLSVISKRVLDIIPKGVFYDVADAFGVLAAKGDLLGYEVKERFYEIGSFKGLKEFNEYIRGG